MKLADYLTIPSPAFVLDLDRLRRNLKVLAEIQEASGVEIILALKGFSLWRIFPELGNFLKGATASSLLEARLIYEEMGCLAYTYAPAFIPSDFVEIANFSSHITFNSCAEYKRYVPGQKGYFFSPGIRVNPEFSPVSVALYNPAAQGSRLGVSPDQLDELLQLHGLEGLHVHVLCESDSFALEGLLQAVEHHFQALLPYLKWINLGGGHLLTRPGYDIKHFIQLVQAFRKKYSHLTVIVEPGSAIVWETGELVATVLDIVSNRGIQTAMLDVSFTAHMPDTLEMPYRPMIGSASSVPLDDFPYAYRLGGASCLAGDYLDAYYFSSPLEVGQKLIFGDMMHYTMVKTSFFNGVKHPEIGCWSLDNGYESWRRFGYDDFRNRLG